MCCDCRRRRFVSYSAMGKDEHARKKTQTERGGKACQHHPFSNTRSKHKKGCETSPFLARKRVARLPSLSSLIHTQLMRLKWTILTLVVGRFWEFTKNKKKWCGGSLLPCSSLLATLSAVFSDWRALLRSRSKTSSGLLPPANAEVGTLSDFLAMSSWSSSSSSTVDDRWGNSIDFKILCHKERKRPKNISNDSPCQAHPLQVGRLG